MGKKYLLRRGAGQHDAHLAPPNCNAMPQIADLRGVQPGFEGVARATRGTSLRVPYLVGTQGLESYFASHRAFFIPSPPLRTGALRADARTGGFCTCSMIMR